MKIYAKKWNAGFTLIELIITMALLGLVSIMVFSIFNFGNTILNKSKTEYEFQFSTKMALAATSNVIRYSTAIFTIPKSSFRADNLDTGWDYIGIVDTANGNEIVKYTYNQATNTHISSVLVPPTTNTRFEFLFTKVNPNVQDSLLQFTLKSFPAGTSSANASLNITSEVESLNSLQVINLSTKTDTAVAIAFRSQDRAINVIGNVAMVMDNSGSMANALDGSYTASNSRISILKTQATNLINKFAQENNIFISLIPFATSANTTTNLTHAFLSAKNSTASLNTTITQLNANGGTNTGDGLRRAYWALKNKNTNDGSGVTSSNYIIILVDGVTTFASVISNTDRTSVTNDSNVNEGFLDRGNGEFNANGQIAGNGSTLDAKGTAYVSAIGALLNANSFAKAYVIGFTSISTELGSVNDIAAACGAPSSRVFNANSSDSLNTVFEAIRQDIVNDLWYLQGPTL